MKKLSVATLSLSILSLTLSIVALSISLSNKNYVDSIRPKKLTQEEREKYKKMANKLIRPSKSGWDMSDPTQREIYAQSEMRKMGIKTTYELTNQTNAARLYRPSMLNIYNKAHKKK